MTPIYDNTDSTLWSKKEELDSLCNFCVTADSFCLLLCLLGGKCVHKLNQPLLTNWLIKACVTLTVWFNYMLGPIT